MEQKDVGGKTTAWLEDEAKACPGQEREQWENHLLTRPKGVSVPISKIMRLDLQGYLRNLQSPEV